MENNEYTNINEKTDGLGTMQSFFKNLTESDQLLPNKSNDSKNFNFLDTSSNTNLVYTHIDISWLFIDNVPRELVQKTVARLLANIPNSNYVNKCIHKFNPNTNKFGISPYDITDIAISASDFRLSWHFTGADGWHKLKVVTQLSENEKHPKEGYIPAIDFSTFEREIAKTMRLEEEHLENRNSDYLYYLQNYDDSNKIRNMNLNHMTIGIHNEIDTAAKNLVEYYKFLQEEKKESFKRNCTFHTNSAHLSTPRKKVGNVTQERKSEIITFPERAKFLESFNPIVSVEGTEYTENGEILPKSYITYIYDKPLEDLSKRIGSVNIPKGYLFVSEPLDGKRESRVYFVPQKEYNSMDVTPGTDKFTNIVVSNLELSPKDFSAKTSGAITIHHTEKESFLDRLQFFITGKMPVLNFRNHEFYQNKIRNLYNIPEFIDLPYHKPRISKSNLADLGLSPTGQVDRTAQETLKNKKISIDR